MMAPRPQDPGRPFWPRWLPLLAVVSPLAITACALPLPMQLASMALNGISYLTTEKSVSDHVITAAVGRDCALHRTVTEGQVCRDGPADTIFIAALDVIPGMVEPAPVCAEPTPMAVDWDRTKGSRAVGVDRGDVPSVRLASGPRPGPAPNPGTETATGLAGEAGLHYVLGSFTAPANARQLIGLVGDLEPSVMVARHGGRTVYQVVVGPVAKDDIEETVTAIVRAGFYDAWPVRLEAREPERGIANRPGRRDEDVAS